MTSVGQIRFVQLLPSLAPRVAGVPVENQKLLFKGQLKDEQTLQVGFACVSTQDGAGSPPAALLAGRPRLPKRACIHRLTPLTLAGGGAEEQLQDHRYGQQAGGDQGGYGCSKSLPAK